MLAEAFLGWENDHLEFELFILFLKIDWINKIILKFKKPIKNLMPVVKVVSNKFPLLAINCIKKRVSFIFFNETNFNESVDVKKNDFFLTFTFLTIVKLFFLNILGDILNISVAKNKILFEKTKKRSLQFELK